MPTIELISIGCPKKPDLPVYDSFAYIVETTLRSHRSLFQTVFDKLTGVIVHLANKEMEVHRDEFWFAGKIMEWDETEQLSSNGSPLMFRPDTLRDVEDLMLRLLAASPEGKIIFTTDYQMGGPPHQCGVIAYSEFFELHARHALRYNCLWYIELDA